MATSTPALAVLPKFPMVNQLSETNPNGTPGENDRFDCVPCSFAAAIEYYTGQHVTGDELKDAEYGESYANSGTALRRYVDDATDLARAKYHVTAVPYSNSNTVWLVGRIHTWLRQGYPVIATIPSQWGTAHDMATLAHPPFSTHVICFYGEIAGGLESMNPWGGFVHSGSDAYWQGRLCEGQIWAVLKEADVPTAVTGVPTGWKDDATAGVLTAPNGQRVKAGFREYVLAHSWAANNWPVADEYSANPVERANPKSGVGTRQEFRFNALIWTAAAGVYVPSIGTEYATVASALTTAQAQVAALQAQLAAAQQAAKDDPVKDAALHALQAVKAALGEL